MKNSNLELDDGALAQAARTDPDVFDALYRRYTSLASTATVAPTLATGLTLRI